MTRTKLPDRRRQWTQKARIGGNVYYLAVGEYPDGSIGEVFLDAHKHGTFARGILDALARTISVALQCGTPLVEICKALRGLSYPPEGTVMGSDQVTEATSVVDWIAQELEAAYTKRTPPGE